MRWCGWLMSWTVSNLDRCLMQTERDAQRIIDMGVRSDAVSVMGSTKFDQSEGRLDEKATRELRASLGIMDGTPVMVAGSTNPGEDEVVLQAFVKMRKKAGDLKLIVAPRQIDRAAEIRGMVENRGFSCTLRSDNDSRGREFDVLILNSYGELSRVYAVAELAFVGGSLIPKGGHSLIQPRVS